MYVNRLVYSDDGSEQPGTAREEVGEDELKPGVVTLGEQVECLCESSQFGVHCFRRDVQDTAVSNSWEFLCVKPIVVREWVRNQKPTLLRNLQSETLGMDAECQMTRRFVTSSRPLSPEFPWVCRRKRQTCKKRLMIR